MWAGPGITSWFVPHEVEGAEGGTVRMNFGPAYGESMATVTAWGKPLGPPWTQDQKLSALGAWVGLVQPPASYS